MASLHNIDIEGKHAQKQLHIIGRLVDSLCGSGFEFWPLAVLAKPKLLCTCLKTNGVLSVFPFPRNQQFTTVWRSPEDKEFPIHTAASNMSQSRSLQITSLILQGKPVCKQQHKNKDWKKTRDLKLNKKKVKNNKQLSSLRCKVQIQCSNVSWLPVVCFYMSALLNASAPKTPTRRTCIWSEFSRLPLCKKTFWNGNLQLVSVWCLWCLSHCKPEKQWKGSNAQIKA